MVDEQTIVRTLVTLAALRDYADAVGLSLELSLEPKRR